MLRPQPCRCCLERRPAANARSSPLHPEDARRRTRVACRLGQTASPGGGEGCGRLPPPGTGCASGSLSAGAQRATFPRGCLPTSAVSRCWLCCRLALVRTKGGSPLKEADTTDMESEAANTETATRTEGSTEAWPTYVPHRVTRLLGRLGVAVPQP